MERFFDFSENEPDFSPDGVDVYKRQALLGKVDSLATLTGMSAASVSANLHAKLLDKTGQAHVGESLMYGIPLGMLSLLNIPFQPPAQVRSPEELKRWVTSVLTDFGVGQGKEARCV